MSSIEARLRALEDSTPKGYEAYDAEGKPTIQSILPALEWYLRSLALLESKGRSAEKNALRSLLARTSGRDNGGGRLHELVAALAASPTERKDENACSMAANERAESEARLKRFDEVVEQAREQRAEFTP